MPGDQVPPISKVSLAEDTVNEVTRRCWGSILSLRLAWLAWHRTQPYSQSLSKDRATANGLPQLEQAAQGGDARYIGTLHAVSAAVHSRVAALPPSPRLHREAPLRGTAVSHDFLHTSGLPSQRAVRTFRFESSGCLPRRLWIPTNTASFASWRDVFNESDKRNDSAQPVPLDLDA